MGVHEADAQCVRLSTVTVNCVSRSTAVSWPQRGSCRPEQPPFGRRRALRLLRVLRCARTIGRRDVALPELAWPLPVRRRPTADPQKTRNRSPIAQQSSPRPASPAYCGKYERTSSERLRDLVDRTQRKTFATAVLPPPAASYCGQYHSASDNKCGCIRSTADLRHRHKQAEQRARHGKRHKLANATKPASRVVQALVN